MIRHKPWPKILVTTPLNPLSEYPQSSIFLTVLPFCPLEVTEQLPFKIKPSEFIGNTQVSFTPWTKMELSAMTKEFPKPREKPYKFF